LGKKIAARATDPSPQWAVTKAARASRSSGVAAYAVVGEGPLILCPAWWVSHLERDWEHPGFRQFFARLAEGFRVVRYDRPGTGLSDRDVPPRTQASEVQLLATVADALGDSWRRKV
jgi:pimeloyl-ACP methyl ester carboxylesterase